jgi:hypothetical protein
MHALAVGHMVGESAGYKVRSDPRMPLFGAHMSIAGGCHNAVLAGRDHGCDALQLFT